MRSYVSNSERLRDPGGALQARMWSSNGAPVWNRPSPEDAVVPGGPFAPGSTAGR